MRKFILTVVFALGFANCFAQTLSTSYFLDHDNYRYRINPSFMPDENVNALFGVLLDNVTLSPQSNIGLSSFLFPVDGELVTGFSKKVPAEQFLGGLNAKNVFDLGLNLNLLTVGFRTDPNGFATIELNARSNSYVDIPKELFSFLKLGSTQNTFQFDNFSVSTAEIAELALGYSRKIGEYVQVGARVKLLCGLARADMVAKNMKLVINSASNTVDVTAQGALNIYTPLITMGTKVTSEGQTVYDLSTMSQGSIGISGFGVAFDLGVSANLFDDALELSLAAQDLGSLNWTKSVSGKMATDATIKLNGEDVEKTLGNLLNFVPELATGKDKLNLPAIFRAGARYSMPFYKRMSVGVLGTLETGDHYNYNELRAGVTVTPVDQISLTANYGATSYGSTMGAACNFNLGPVQLFFGTDAVIFEFTPQYVPVNKINTTLTGGLLFQIKKSKS